MKTLSIITTKTDYQKNLHLNKTKWEVKANHFLMQSKNPDVYILDVGLFPNAFEVAMESLIRIACRIVQENGTNFEYLNLVLHKTDFMNGVLVSKYNTQKEFRVPEFYVNEILKSTGLQDYISQVKVYLFSHLQGSLIMQSFEGNGDFINLYRNLERIDKTWLNYWYAKQVLMILRKTNTGLTIEEREVCLSSIKNQINKSKGYENEIHVRISAIFKKICNWEDGNTRPISKEAIKFLVEELNKLSK